MRLIHYVVFINARMSEVVKMAHAPVIGGNHGNPPSSACFPNQNTKRLSALQAFRVWTKKHWTLVLSCCISLVCLHGLNGWLRKHHWHQDSDTPRWWKQCSPQDRVWWWVSHRFHCWSRRTSEPRKKCWILCVCVCVCDFVGCNMCIMKSHESISPSCAQNNWKFIAGATFQTKSPMATTTLVKEQIQNGVFGWFMPTIYFLELNNSKPWSL